MMIYLKNLLVHPIIRNALLEAGETLVKSISLAITTIITQKKNTTIKLSNLDYEGKKDVQLLN